MKLFLLLALVCLGAAEERLTYEGYKVFSFALRTNTQAESIVTLMDEDVELDFWKEPTDLNEEVVVMVPPHKLAFFEDFLNFNHIQFRYIMEDLTERIQADYDDLEGRDTFDLNRYNRYAWIMDEMDNMVGRCPGALTCTTRVIGQSLEGRDLKVMTISSGSGRQSIFIDSLIHAREWLAGATTLRIMDRLTRDYDSDAEVRELIDAFDWHFFPVVNPDGYEFSHTSDRMWRKNRRVNSGSSCRGVDLNRNHDYRWNTGGSSGNPCSQTFRGPSAASEIEIQNFQAEGERIGGSNIMSWATVHTFGWYWLTPYGDCSVPPDNDDLMQVTNAICDAIRDTSGRTWRCGNSCRTLYATSGSTSDWTRGHLGVKYSYTPELRGPGFTVPPSQIEPSYREIWNGYVAMVREINDIEG